MNKLLLILLIGLPLAAFWGGMQYQRRVYQSANSAIESAAYTNKTVGFGFFHPTTVTVDECADGSCAMIETISLRVQALTGEINYMTDDLFCSADGPMGGVACQTKEVEPIVTLKGVKGYKLYRHKIITGANSGEMDDIAYVFPLTDTTYSGVLMAVDEATDSNQAALQVIADSFFLTAKF